MTDGKPLYTDDGFSGSIMSYFAEEFLFFSLVPPQGILKREIETSAMTVEGDPLDCGLFQFELWPRFPQSPPKDAFCISQATGDMVLKQTQTFSVRYADFEPFLNHSVPRSITASKGRQVRCRIQVSKLEQWNTDDAALAAPAEASSVSPAPNKWSTDNSEITPIDAKFTSPPAAPMGTYVNGPVALIILISRTGVVSDVESLMAPNPETALYAASLVRHWTYKPILRDGRPIEDITDAFLNLKFQIAPIAASSGAKQ